MKIDKELIKHVAKTARIELTDSEIKEFLPQLKEILETFSKIKKVPTTNIKPSYHPVQLEGIMREDIPKECLDNETALRNTLHKKEGYFKGPRIL